MFSTAKAYLFGGTAGVLLLLAGWALRVNHLRDVHQQHLTEVSDALTKAGYKKFDDDGLGGLVVDLTSKRDKAIFERDRARELVDVQSASITKLEDDTAKAKAEAEAQHKLVVEATRQRDLWIARAKTAATRTERRSAQEEVTECEQVLDSLYSSGF